MRKIYVDNIEVTELKCKDNKTRKVKTPEYDNCNNNTHTFSAQSK